jgi:WD40 repeat protein
MPTPRESASAIPQTGRFPIFLSYARADDEPFVAELHRLLAERGIRAWWDRADMPSRALTFLQEIRDAIAGAERLVLVAGPAAFYSDYVRAEWQYALALSKPVIPVLRIGEMEDLPPEVGRVHCIDARAARPAEQAFDELLRVLGEPLPLLGAFLTPVPALPPYFQPRTADMSRLAGELFVDQDRPVTMTGSQRVLVVHGLPGMGKSVLAAAFARSTGTRRSFPDGVLWLPAHQVASADLAKLLGGNGTTEDDDEETPAVLVVIDDASQLAEIEPILNRLGNRARMLVTTRNAGLARSLGARELFLDALAPDATLRQLADWAGASVDALPATAHEVAKWCAGLPFATAVCGAMARGGRMWEDLLEALRQADLAFLAHAVPNYPHASVLACLSVAVEGLPAAEASLLADLRVFPRAVAIADALVLRFWAAHRQLGARAARDALARLAERALLRWEGEPRTVQLHALEHDFLRARDPDAASLHRAMVEMYRADCPTGWAAGPNDGYFFEWFLHHLAGSGDAEGATRLLFDPAWMQAKLRAVGLHALIADYGGELGGDPEAEQEVREALLRAAPALQSAPDHLAALLADRLPEPVRRATVELAARLRNAVPFPRFRLLTRTLTERSGGLVVTVRTPGRRLHAIALLPGNERFATASEDGTLCIHALDTGRVVDEVRGSGELEAACALPDGRHVTVIARLSGGAGSVLELYDLHERVLREVGRSDATALESVCALADGTLVTGADDGELTHWDPLRAVRLRRWRQPEGHRGDPVSGLPNRTIEAVLALPGGQRVASLLAGRWLSVWNVQAGKMEWATAVERRVEAIALAGDALVAVALDGTVTFHDPKTGAVQRRVELDLPGRVTAFALHAPSMKAVWATQIASWRFFYGRAELYAVSLTGAKADPLLCGTHDVTVEAMAIAGEGSILVSGSLDGTVRLWDLRRAAQRREVARHLDRVTALELFDDERKLLTASYDGTLKIWRTADGVQLREFVAEWPDERVTSAALIERSRVVYAQADGDVVVMDMKTGGKRWSEKIHRYGMGVVGAAPAIHGFLTGDRYGWVKAWTERGKAWKGQMLGTPGDEVDGILVVGEGPYALAWDRGEGRLHAYDLAAGEDEAMLWSARFGGPNEAVLLLPKDRCAFPIEEDERYAIAGVSLRSGKRSFTLSGFGEVTCLAAAPGAAELAVGMKDGSVELRNVRAHTSRARLAGHTGEIVALRFLDNRLLVSIGIDFTLRLWDVVRAELLAVFGADGRLHRLAVTSAGDRVIVTELSGQVHFLEVERGKGPLSGPGDGPGKRKRKPEVSLGPPRSTGSRAVRRTVRARG